MTRRTLLAGAFLALTAGGALASIAVAGVAQSRDESRTRAITAARQLRNGDSLRVRVTHAAGPLRVMAASSPVLYELSLRYEPSRGTFVRRYDPETRTLSIGMDSASVALRPRIWRGTPDDGRHQPNALTLALGAGVPLDLSLDYGAAEARVDLSGLTVDRLAMRCGASETQLAFGTPNPARMRELSIDCAAGHLTVRRLGNANAHRVEIRGVAAGLELDLSGAWAHDMEIDVGVVLGGVKLRVPEGVGVHVIADRELLAKIETPGLHAREDGRYSANWDTAARKLTVSADAILGGVVLSRE